MSAGNSNHWGVPWGFSVPAATPLGVQSTQFPRGDPQDGSQLTMVGTNSLIHLSGFSSFPVLFLLTPPTPILTSWDHFRITYLCPCPGSAPVRAACLVTQSCLTPCDPMDCSPPGLCPRDSPGNNAGVGCHSLFQGIFPTQGSNLCLLHL